MKIRLAMENNEFNSIQLRRGQNGTKCSKGVTRLYLLRKPRPMRIGNRGDFKRIDDLASGKWREHLVLNAQVHEEEQVEA